MRKNIVAGNWKMNKNLQEGIALAKELNEVHLYSVHPLGFGDSDCRQEHHRCRCRKLCR